MFERLCALLFRLYPRDFRRTYGREAWQLIRDRAEVERSLYLRLRLLIDLFVDVFATTLRGWHGRPALVAASEVRDGSPRFIFIEHRPLHPQWRLFGMLASLLMFAAFLLGFQPKEFADGPAQLGYGPGADASADPGTDDPDATAAVDISALRREIVEAVARNLKEHYYDPDHARLLGNAILTYERNGAYDHLAVGPGLANRLTNHIYDAGRGLGVPAGVPIADVVFIDDKLRRGPPGGFPADCRVRRVETMRRNIGYIKLDAFGPANVCHDAIAKAMGSVNDAGALIVDLRDNGGGVGETALQMASALFERPVFMFDPRPRSRVPSHTTPVAASRLVDKPVYLLTSSMTQSAAEYFVYNLRMHNRVTIVGERTAGAEHSGVYRGFSDHFGIAIQEEPPPPSPFAVKGWEIIGVEPDVRVPSDMALRTAIKLANSR